MMSIEEITPGRQRIFCSYPSPEVMSKGGIILPENRDKPAVMPVVKVGESITEDIQPGDRVIFDGFAGSTFKVDGKEYLSLKEGDILCVIKQE